MRTVKIMVQPYNYPLYIATSEQAWDMLGLEPGDCYGAVVSHKGKMYVALPESYREDVTWHEAHHVARMINAHHGVPTCSDEHEADCYMQEHVVSLIKKKVYKLK
jgi:hypothetical protein